MIVRADNAELLAQCAAVRRSVFGEEEHGPEALCIIDEHDTEDTTGVYLYLEDGIPAGTARFIRLDEGTAKLQRVAVRADLRRRGIGAALLKTMEEAITAQGLQRIVMDAAEKSVGFYTQYGYRAVSDVFYEDGRPHVAMEKELKQNG